ncbi:MAG: DUF4197 domain-containing protein, partial [Bacillota bacterium]
MKKIILISILISIVVFSANAFADWYNDLQKAVQNISGNINNTGNTDNNKESLSEEQIIAGLKEALKVGSENAVNSSGKVDGFFGNPKIKIPMPEKLQKVEQGLRKVGAGKMADDFILSMNRAAEQAAP